MPVLAFYCHACVSYSQVGGCPWLRQPPAAELCWAGFRAVGQRNFGSVGLHSSLVLGLRLTEQLNLGYQDV